MSDSFGRKRKHRQEVADGNSISSTGDGITSEMKRNAHMLTFNLTSSPGLVGGYTTTCHLISDNIVGT